MNFVSEGTDVGSDPPSSPVVTDVSAVPGRLGHVTDSPNIITLRLE